MHKMKRTDSKSDLQDPNVGKMNLNVIDLPELILHEICLLLKCPFDLISFGSTCQKLNEVASVPSLWIRMAQDWCEGIWQWITEVPSVEDPKTWFLTLLQNASRLPHDTKSRLCLGEGEEWFRTESKKFRSYVGMLRWAYGDRDEYRHPAILFRRWIYDVALFRRIQSQFDFGNIDLLPISVKRELAALGGGAQRDLRARKFPNIDPVYYVHFVRKSYLENLFPIGCSGSLCPLLIGRTECEFNREMSGPGGLLICVSTVAANLLIARCLNGEFSLSEMTHTIRSICRTFYTSFMEKLDSIPNRTFQFEIKSIILQVADSDDPIFDGWQRQLDKLNLGLKWREIVQGCVQLLKEYEWLDAVVDKVKKRWRHLLQEEIFSTLGISKQQPQMVTQVNLTDSDLIGGDNRRQEMSSAAFITNSGILVTWQLTGRGRY